ncbi:MAG: hypothetical protein PHG89_04260 [Gallionella sp.]|nr:hypothetical protein [Gallionella sp.]
MNLFYYSSMEEKYMDACRSVIPAKAGIQSIKQHPPNAGAKSKGISNKTAGFRPSPE